MRKTAIDWARALVASALVASALVASSAPSSSARAEDRPGDVDASEQGPMEEPLSSRWTLQAGVLGVVDSNTGGAMVTLYGVSLGATHWLHPAVGIGLSSSGSLTSRGTDNVWTLQIHHYTTAWARTRLHLGTIASVGVSAGPALVVEHHRHHGGSRTVWASAAAPALAFGVDLTALADGFGVRFHVDGWASELGLDIGAGTQLVLPL